MPTIFLSYSRDDTAAGQELQDVLRTEGHSVWRDQDSLYAGEQWPKAIGQGLLESDVVVLIWSRGASSSHFVQFEWTTGIALKRPIVPYCIDNTPLPPLLAGIRSIKAFSSPDAISLLKRSVRTASPSSDSKRANEVLDVLSRLPKGDVEGTTQAAISAISQHGWVVQGPVNIYVGGDQASTKDKSLWELWQVRLGVLVAALTVVGWFIDLPARLKSFLPDGSGATTQMIAQTLAGIVWDEEGNPLPGVTIVVTELGLTAVTDENGRYEFLVENQWQISVNIIAKKEGFKTHDADATLGNPSFNFTMKRLE